MLGDRPLSMIAREILQPRNYLALWSMRRVYPRSQWRENCVRYFLARGTYPYACQVLTPVGVAELTLHHPHDMFTVNEVFCRRDYEAGPDLGAVVDIGSNIGVSAMYFLTRNRRSRCYLYEPVPTNAERLRENLAGLEQRYKLTAAAVSDRAGAVSFGVEVSGRYGGIGVPTGRTIQARCLEINDVLDRVLSVEPHIDVLKIDTEGAELRTVRAIRPENLRRIRTIFLELEAPARLHPELFDERFANQTARLTNRSMGSAAGLR